MKKQLINQNDILDVIDRIARLSDDATVSAELAALYLGFSVKTLARWRQTGNGPSYYQYDDPESTARNQKVTYRMGDLRDWRNQHRVTSSMDAAMRRCMAFNSLYDLAGAYPFWQTRQEEIVSPIACMTKETFAEVLRDFDGDVVWLSWRNALHRRWKEQGFRGQFQLSYVELLNSLVNEVLHIG